MNLLLIIDKHYRRLRFRTLRARLQSLACRFIRQDLNAYLDQLEEIGRNKRELDLIRLNRMPSRIHQRWGSSWE